MCVRVSGGLPQGSASPRCTRRQSHLEPTDTCRQQQPRAPPRKKAQHATLHVGEQTVRSGHEASSRGASCAPVGRSRAAHRLAVTERCCREEPPAPSDLLPHRRTVRATVASHRPDSSLDRDSTSSPYHICAGPRFQVMHGGHRRKIDSSNAVRNMWLDREYGVIFCCKIIPLPLTLQISKQ